MRVTRLLQFVYGHLVSLLLDGSFIIMLCSIAVALLIAYAIQAPNARAAELTVSSPQANGVVDASVFLRRAYHSSVVLNRRAYIDGGEFSFKKGNDISYESSNALISIDLTQDWANGSVTLHSNPKPPEVPNLSYGGIWVDRKTGVLYTGFAGTAPFFGDITFSPQGLWSYTPDGSGSGSWENLNGTADASFINTPRPFKGQVASGRGFGFFLGGIPGFLGNATGRQQPQPLGRFMTYDFSSRQVANSNGWEPSGNIQGWGHSGGIDYVPNFGNRGMLINMGGHRDRRDDDNDLVSFETVQVYDVDSQRWFEQKTTGDIPQSRKEFCIAGAPSNKRTYEILIYAGWDGHTGAAAIPYDSAYVLTLPGFYWARANYPPKHPRHGLTCNAVGGSQILTIGGVDTADRGQSGEASTAGFDTPDPFTQGLAIFDLSQLAWVSSYTAKRDLQPPAAKIQHYYKNHGRQPQNGFSTPDLATLFSTSDFSDPDAGSSSSAASYRHTSNTGAIVGGVVGGAAGVAAAAGVVALFLRRRKKRRRAASAVSEGEGEGDAKADAANVEGEGGNGGGREGVHEVEALDLGCKKEQVTPASERGSLASPVEIAGEERIEIGGQGRPGELSGEAAVVEMPGESRVIAELP